MPNKLRERWYLEQVCQAIDLHPDTIDWSERPDFLLISGCHRVGIELTDFFLPPREGERPYQEQQSLKNQIVERAKRLHAEAGGPAFYVSVNFHPSFPLRTQNRQPYALALAASVLRSPLPHARHESMLLPWGHRPPSPPASFSRKASTAGIRIGALMLVAWRHPSPAINCSSSLSTIICEHSRPRQHSPTRRTKPSMKAPSTGSCG
jgi:hypothetical protein